MPELTGSQEQIADDDWDNYAKSSDPLFQDFKRHIELTDEQMTGIGHAYVANGWRDQYMSNGSPIHIETALRHYEIALSDESNNRLEQAWILCHRLNLYLYEYYGGRLPIEVIEEQITLAQDLARSSHNLDHPRMRSGTLKWLDNTRLDIRPTVEMPSTIPAVAGELAVEASGGLIIEPEPVIVS